ncbi:hypothetical protein OS493_029142 [Desmophyllum pertusum]|uniref:Opine dehydrogenase domain-containing protein n=1 Tax=Desmophyllum pertusum TaxID=174260 RepID=A0A9W9Y943_9CNID|nr:hypothetical protein OS493_029142 [Desmophyllum pertusum]
MSSTDSIKLLICGSGNGAHAFAGIASSHPGTEVRVLSLYQDEAERWSKALETADLEITCHRRDQEPSVIRSKPALITKNPEDAVRGVDIIAFVLPAFAHQVFLEALKPYIEPGVIIVGLPGASGLEFQVRGVLGDKANTCTVMNFETLPWACRLGEFGRKCDVLGTKESISGAMQVGRDAAPKKDPVTTLQSLIGDHPRLKVAGHLIGMTIMCPKYLHPSIMFSQWEGWDGKPVSEPPLFYTGLSELAAEILSSCSDEVLKLGRVVGEKSGVDTSQVTHLYDLIVKFYPQEISDTTSLRSVFRTNAAYQGLKHPMKETADHSFVPDFAHRYLTEDIPYGLVVIRGIAEIVQVDTPTIDKVLLWAQEKVGKEYLVGAKLQGKDVPSTRAPQRYGLTTLDAILGRV